MATTSIFGGALRIGAPAGPRVSTTASPGASPGVLRPAHSTRPSITSPADVDWRILSILESPLAIGETALAGFSRKEAELRTLFASLTVSEQRALQARLSNPRTGDPVATHFARFTADRRHRLITFLADARRREALATARR